MKIIPLHELYSMDFTVTGITVMKQSVDFLPNFSCMDKPKQKNMLLYLDNCDAHYTFKDGTQLLARSGDIIYNPIGSCYSVEFYAQTKNASTIRGVLLRIVILPQRACLNK